MFEHSETPLHKSVLSLNIASCLQFHSVYTFSACHYRKKKRVATEDEAHGKATVKGCLKD